MRFYIIYEFENLVVKKNIIITKSIFWLILGKFNPNCWFGIIIWKKFWRKNWRKNIVIFPKNINWKSKYNWNDKKWIKYLIRFSKLTLNTNKWNLKKE